MSDNGCTANEAIKKEIPLTGDVFIPRNTPEKFIAFYSQNDELKFCYNGTILHNSKVIGKSQDLIDEMLKFFKKANSFEEYNRLGDLAKQVVIRTMQEGEVSHPANDFMDRPMEEHGKHASLHLEDASVDIMSGYVTEDTKKSLEHSLTRVVIMLAKMEVEHD